jgi:hypothetical protein
MEIISREEAREQGLKRFFTGNPCTKGHVSERLVSNKACCACRHNYWDENQEYIRKKNNEYRAANKDKHNQSSNNCKRNNPGKYITLVLRRRLKKKQAIPGWFNEAEVKKVYKQCRELTTLTGIEHELDHIVPLVSPYVCGLHWHGNMQILTKTENRRKNNNYWPDMPDISDPELRAMAKAFKDLDHDS